MTDEKYPLLKDYLCEDGLHWQPGGGRPYVSYVDGDSCLCLDGSFTVEFLEELVLYMREANS